MKKILLTLSVVLLSVGNMLGMSHSAIRENARFLSDRMAYELDMTAMQYDDCYEINYDFISAIAVIMDDVVRGYPDAIDRYYRYLDYRNDDLRFILTASQYRRFLGLDYFYRPVYTYAGNWLFRVFQVYNNHSFFYLDAPRVYHGYHGEHGRSHHSGGYYGGSGHYSHSPYQPPHSIHGSDNMHGYSRSDFGHNRHERGERYGHNDYNNRNQHDRMSDPRYRDDRQGTNHNTSGINGHGNGTRPNNNGGNSGNRGNSGGNGGNGGHSGNNNHGNANPSGHNGSSNGHSNGNGGHSSNNGGHSSNNAGGHSSNASGRSTRH